MDNKFNNFDDIIKNKLAQLDLSNKMPDWDAFEEKLDTAHQENASFDDDSFVDELSHAKLANNEVPYQPEHWVQMSERIELDRILTRKLIKYKLIEAVLVVFAIFTFINLFPVRKEIKHNLKEKIEQLQNKIEGQEQPSINNAPQKATIQPTKPMAAITPRAEIISPVQIENLISDDQTETIVSDISSTDAKAAVAAAHIVSLLTMTEQKLTTNNSKAITLPLAVTNQNIDKPIENKTKRIFESATLAMLDGNTVSFSNTANKIGLSLIKPKIRKKKIFSFSGVAGIDANYINSPYDNISDVDSDTTAAIGYSGGFNFNMQISSRIGIQTGLVYSFKRYQPNTPTDILQAQNFKFKEEFKGIELDIVQIPLNIRYDYFIRAKNRLYVLGGASINTIASTKYEIDYKQENRLAAPPNPAQFAYAQKQSDLNKKDFEPGVFEGGKFFDNSYITANFSLGLEHYISPRISFFMQPRFQYYFPFQDGLGPNNDKIHSYSILLGTKINVW